MNVGTQSSTLIRKSIKQTLDELHLIASGRHDHPDHHPQSGGLSLFDLQNSGGAYRSNLATVWFSNELVQTGQISCRSDRDHG